MNEPAAPFDEFGHPDQNTPETPRGSLLSWIRCALQAVSFGALWLAFLTAVFIAALHTFRMLGGHPPDFLPTLKSAIPLILIGLSYISLIFTVPRTAAQRVLGILVGLAFTLWGIEQFMQDQRWISFIDDIVVFLFVLDLSIVIRGNLAGAFARRRARQA